MLFLGFSLEFYSKLNGINEYYFGATGGGLCKTTDGGQEWASVTDGKISCSSTIGAVAMSETNPQNKS
jgi:photosystem II stability/assembly factor-like uncharacterized protein